MGSLRQGVVVDNAIRDVDAVIALPGKSRQRRARQTVESKLATLRAAEGCEKTLHRRLDYRRRNRAADAPLRYRLRCGVGGLTKLVRRMSGS